MDQEELEAIIGNLPRAQTVELYRLAHAIRVLHNDALRVHAIRNKLHVDMSVRFFDTNTGTFRDGRIISLRNQYMTIDEAGRNLRHTRVPYAAIDLQQKSNVALEEIESSDMKQEVPATTEDYFAIGDLVTFDNRNHIPLVGKIILLNPKIATIQTDW